MTEHKRYPCSIDGYTLADKIGSGAFALVYRATVKETNEAVAIKVFDRTDDEKARQQICKEVDLMRLLRHPNIVPIHCSFFDDTRVYLVMPLLMLGSCASILQARAPNGFKDDAAIATLLRQVLEGLCYLHKNGIIHRDIKAANILVGGDGTVQLADLGVAGLLIQGGVRKPGVCTITGSPSWMAPEVVGSDEARSYDSKADIWSVGITAMELGYGRAPYARYPPIKAMRLIVEEEPPTCQVYSDKPSLSKEYYDFIKKCLCKDPAKRPTASKLLQHKFIQKWSRDGAYLITYLSRLDKP